MAAFAGFKDAEDVILKALQAAGPNAPEVERERREAIERLQTFGKTTQGR
jgi:hypothetical protein